MAIRETARLEARVPVQVYAALKRAAAIKGGTLTDFVVKALQSAAQQTIEEADIIRLSAEDQLRFAEALIDPPTPDKALLEARRLHRENVEAR